MFCTEESECSMPTQPEWVINNEILECAKQCIASDDPEPCAHAYAQELVAKGWSTPDAGEVAQSALSIMAHLAKSRPDGLENATPGS